MSNIIIIPIANSMSTAKLMKMTYNLLLKLPEARVIFVSPTKELLQEHQSCIETLSDTYGYVPISSIRIETKKNMFDYLFTNSLFGDDCKYYSMTMNSNSHYTAEIAFALGWLSDKMENTCIY